ncbi:hypothetical protein ACNS7O_03930 [Haloferacaceae archaeon DSL9]
MVKDEGGTIDRGRKPDSLEDGPGVVGVAFRFVLAVGALVVGLAWVVRLAVGGPSLSDGLLFELLGPALILYLGSKYFRTQLARLRAIRGSSHDDTAER